jgi:hypothetical protein
MITQGNEIVKMWMDLKIKYAEIEKQKKLSTEDVSKIIINLKSISSKNYGEDGIELSSEEINELL